MAASATPSATGRVHCNPGVRRDCPGPVRRMARKTGAAPVALLAMTAVSRPRWTVTPGILDNPCNAGCSGSAGGTCTMVMNALLRVICCMAKLR